MKTIKEVINEQLRSREAHDDKLTDQLMAEIVTLAEEVCVLRDRLDSGEQLAAAGKPADKASVDAFELDSEIIEQRLARHRAFFEQLFARIGKAASNVQL